MKPETKNCKSCEQDFVVGTEDFGFYEKMNVPAPTLCWRCRAMRRMAFRNMTHMYKRKCDATGEDIFTYMSEDAPMPVYSSDYWRSDNWDALEYGRDYDPSRLFFDQMKDLFHSVPWAPMWNYEKVNSDYSISAFIKNCYQCFDSGNSTEDCGYCVSVQFSKNCFNLINCKKCELCYFCINTDKSYKTFFSRNCVSCSEVWFSQDMVGCTSCFGCTGLRNKQYYIFNKQYNKEEYELKVAELLKDFEGSRKRAMEVWMSHPVKYMHGVQNKDSVGDYISNSAEMRTCFFASEAQNCAYSQSTIYEPIKDCMDISSVGEGVELDYEVICSGMQLQNVAFAADCLALLDSQYVLGCISSSRLFGCVNLRSKKHCILNKQYSKEEYEKLRAKIIEDMKKSGEYGEFFPSSMSPWGYNETQAQDYFPLSKEEALKLGFKWKEQDKSAVAEGEGVVQCEHGQKCEHLCSGAFKMTPGEISFCDKFGLPYPKQCFNCRYKELVNWRNEPALYPRQCMCNYEVYKNEGEHSHHKTGRCQNEFETSYAPEREEIIYCESCYNSEVV